MWQGRGNICTFGIWEISVLRVIMMCQCRFIDFDKYATLLGDVDSGEAVSV